MATFGELKMSWDIGLMQADLLFSDGDLVTDAGLSTAVLMSLFTDARANEQDVLPSPGAGRRGWWGDATSSIENDRIGSKCWLLERSKATQEVGERMSELILESLQWLKDDGIASTIRVYPEIYGPVNNRHLAFTLEIYKTDGTKMNVQFDNQWEATVNGI